MKRRVGLNESGEKGTALVGEDESTEKDYYESS